MNPSHFHHYGGQLSLPFSNPIRLELIAREACGLGAIAEGISSYFKQGVRRTLSYMLETEISKLPSHSSQNCGSQNVISKERLRFFSDKSNQIKKVTFRTET